MLQCLFAKYICKENSVFLNLPKSKKCFYATLSHPQKCGDEGVFGFDVKILQSLQKMGRGPNSVNFSKKSLNLGSYKCSVEPRCNTLDWKLISKRFWQKLTFLGIFSTLFYYFSGSLVKKTS